MVQHIVFWNLKDFAEGGAKEENARIIKERLEALAGKIEGTLKMEVRPNFNPDGYDLVLYSLFESREALDFYKDHPLHKAVQKFVHSVITDRAVTDSDM